MKGVDTPHRVNLEPDRDIFNYDVRRTSRIGWIIESLTIISSIAFLAGPLSSWQIQVISLLIIVNAASIAIEYFTKSHLAYIPVALSVLIIPIYYGHNQSEPWVSYGLVTIISIIYVASFSNSLLSIGLIYLLIILQYVVARLNLPGVSDNADDALLNGYFSIAWCAIIGVGAIVLKRAYLRYSDSIEESINDIYRIQLNEEERVSQLNLRDYENSQLHGTILNTLIAVRNSGMLRTDRLKVVEYLKRDLSLLSNHRSSTAENLENFLNDESNFPFQRPLEIIFKINDEIKLDEETSKLVLEILREAVLNIKKHTQSTKCVIYLAIVDKEGNVLDDVNQVGRQLLIKVQDFKGYPENENLELQLEETKKSISFERLIKNINGELEVTIAGNRICRRVLLPLPESLDQVLTKVGTLRKESANFLIRGYIQMTLLFAVITFPAYIYLGIKPHIATLLALSTILTGAALFFRNYQLHLSALGSLISIAIFPLFTQSDMSCDNLTYLPWLFNGIIGSALFVTALIENKVIKWIPLLLFYLSTLEIASKLPKQCEHLLDGSTPGIILIALIAIGVAFARRRELTFESKLISQTRSTLEDFKRIRENVIVERRKLLARLDDFVLKCEMESAANLESTLEQVILEVRAFLLCSEYFEYPLISTFYKFIQSRFQRNVSTRLEISTSQFKSGLSQRELDLAIKQIGQSLGDAPAEITITSGASINVDINAAEEFAVKPLKLSKKGIRINLQ